jgi:hypothetical protein
LALQLRATYFICLKKVKMLSPIDNILFPDECEIFEIAQNQYVYAIYKNGRSSLNKANFKKIDIGDIENLTTIDIFIRDPFERYISGVETYIKFLGRDNDYIDVNTIIKQLDQFLFLNRHFTLQFHWLVNLGLFVNKDVNLTFRPMNELSLITEIHHHQGNKHSEMRNRLRKHFSQHNQLQYYLLLDNLLYKDLLGKTVTFKEVMLLFKTSYTDVYNEVVGKLKTIANVLP